MDDNVQTDEAQTSGAPKVTEYNPLYDPATDNQPILDDVQSLLNQPMEDPTGFDEADEAFIYDVVAKFDSGEIKPHSPSSLLNEDVYEAMDDTRKGKADQNAFNILSRLRSIYDQWKANPVPTLQIQNEIHFIRLTKERLESELGDVYKV